MDKFLEADAGEAFSNSFQQQSTSINCLSFFWPLPIPVKWATGFDAQWS